MGNIVYPGVLVNDTLADADVVMQYFNAITAQVNGNLTAANMGTDIITSAQLAALSVGTSELQDGAATSRKVALTSGLVFGTGAEMNPLPSSYTDVPGATVTLNPAVPSVVIATATFHFTTGTDTTTSIAQCDGQIVADGVAQSPSVQFRLGVFSNSGHDGDVDTSRGYRFLLAAGSRTIKLQAKGNGSGDFYTRCAPTLTTFTYFMFAQ